MTTRSPERPETRDLLPERTREEHAVWHVLHVKSRQEMVLADLLSGMRKDVFLPVLPRVTYHGRRKARADSPLFPGYLFLWGTLDDAYEADRTGRVAQLIPVFDQDRLEWELENVHRALGAGVPLDPSPALKESVRVLVRAGPFKGLEGVVSAKGREDRLLLQVDMLGQAVALEIDGSLLVPLDD